MHFVHVCTNIGRYGIQIVKLAVQNRRLPFSELSSATTLKIIIHGFKKSEYGKNQKPSFSTAILHDVPGPPFRGYKPVSS